MTSPPSTCPRPELVTRTDDQGRLWVACLTCRETSDPTTHRPLAEQWRKNHLRNA